MPDIVAIRITFIRVEKNPFLVVIWFKTGQKQPKIDFLWENLVNFGRFWTI